MRKLSISMGTCLLFFTTSCTITTNNTDSFTQNFSNKETLNKKTFLVETGRGKGGNSEVKTINQCFKFKSQARNECLNIFYPDNINITIYPQSGEIIKLAGRKSSIEKREFNLGGEDRFILHLDISTVELPVNCNVKTAKLSQDKNILIVDMDVKDIKNRVTLYDKNNKLLLEYIITKD